MRMWTIEDSVLGKPPCSPALSLSVSLTLPVKAFRPYIKIAYIMCIQISTYRLPRPRHSTHPCSVAVDRERIQCGIRVWDRTEYCRRKMNTPNLSWFSTNFNNNSYNNPIKDAYWCKLWTFNAGGQRVYKVETARVVYPQSGQKLCAQYSTLGVQILGSVCSARKFTVAWLWLGQFRRRSRGAE